MTIKNISKAILKELIYYVNKNHFYQYNNSDL